MLDISDSPSFIGTLDRHELTRINVHSKVELSEEARSSYNALKAKIYAENHTDRPHNRRDYACDVEHTIREAKEIPGMQSGILVAEDKPAWAKRRYYLLAALFGLSWTMRTKMYEKSQSTSFNVVKLISKIEKGARCDY